ncbi:MAG: ATPase/protein kinase [Cyclobacteriaceae bacterium]|nr:MAG: ATPase/protein kinase [Cyclobacteriaceae bacterium]
MQYLDPNRVSADQYINGVLEGDLVMLARALSLIESSRIADTSLKLRVLEGILPKTGNALRVGITGAPGVGKSTFIEELGLMLVEKGYKLAILTIDPSSQRSRGSILGDKTRMDKLSKSDSAFIRPTAAGSSLGGVAQHTRESILLCEAAGYNVVFVETVGVGQSEIQVRNIVDYFLLLMISGAGDELQGLKKGVMEMADGLAITKVDGENIHKAKLTQTTFQNALQYLVPASSEWQPKVFTCSAFNKTGIEDIWDNVEQYFQQMKDNGYLEHQRQNQRLIWLDDCMRSEITRHFQQINKDEGSFERLKGQVQKGTILPNRAVVQIIEQLISK